MNAPRVVTHRLTLLATILVASGLLSGYAISPRASAVSAPGATGRVAGKHMLFRVRGPAGATVYLLGSVHLLDPQAGKLPAEVDSAFAHAKTVTFEASLDTAQMRGMELMTRGQFSGGATLRSSLSPAGAAKADSVLKPYGLSVDQANRFKPWFVSALMAQMVMRKAKFEPQYGVDVQLNNRAKQAGKPVMSLESVDFQWGLFDRIPMADQERMLTTTADPDSSAQALSRIKDAWTVGDATLLDSLLNRAAVEAPGFFAIVITDRNRNWIPKIEDLVKGKDDALVVVGAAHLVGSQGVVAMLKAKGYTVEQM
jgi:uncharacterized protein YbaP (TraB family)